MQVNSKETSSNIFPQKQCFTFFSEFGREAPGVSFTCVTEEEMNNNISSILSHSMWCVYGERHSKFQLEYQEQTFPLSGTKMVGARMVSRESMAQSIRITNRGLSFKADKVNSS